MRLAELSARSGVSTATIKYYLREGLLHPGRRVTATQAEYDEGHLRRLRLVRALIQVGKIPVASAREVLAALQDGDLDRNERLGSAVWALPHEYGTGRRRPGDRGGRSAPPMPCWTGSTGATALRPKLPPHRRTGCW